MIEVPASRFVVVAVDDRIRPGEDKSRLEKVFLEDAWEKLERRTKEEIEAEQAIGARQRFFLEHNLLPG